MSTHTLYELRCRECGKTWGNIPRSFCEDCFSPLEVAYDYDSLKKIARRENLARRDFNMGRYSELLPLPEGFTGPNAVGGTPLVASRKLASHWGLKNLYFKNDAVCFPSLSFKDRVVAMAGGSLITKIAKAFRELVTLGWVEAKPVKFFGAQATGCSPISDAVKRNLARFKPQKPNTIARSLAIGNPADGPFAVKQILESSGWAEDVSDPEIVAAIKLLAETEGIFTETAGGVTTGVTQKLLAQNRIKPDDTTVVCITGNGLKTTDAIAAEFPASEAIAPRLDAFEAYLDSQLGTAAASAKA